MKATILVASALALASTATAQTKSDTPKDTVRFQRRTLIEFSDVEVTGEVTRPEATLVNARTGARFRSLIRYRGDFRPELLSSLDAL